MEYAAHKRELPSGEWVVQRVSTHLRVTALGAAQCLKPVGLAKAGELAGLLHDIGKLRAAYQQYLAEGDPSKRGSVIHTFQGCRYLMERYHREEDSRQSVIASDLLAFAIGAHHGLFDCVDATRRIGLRYRTEKQGTDYEACVQALFQQGISEQEIDQLFSAASDEIATIITQLSGTYADDEEYCFVVGLLARLLLSAVIEGDRRDTAAFMTGITPTSWPEDRTPIWSERLSYLEEKLKQFPNDSPIAAARRVISEQCATFVSNQSGIYRLTVPTGGGKTLSSLRYALAHAKCFNKKRLIFTSPLLSILEQNAEVIRAFVGDDGLILEHHSNVVQEEAGKDALSERELLTQSWDAPIIITTLVQFLNTLFDGRTTSIRRFQALCESVIVIDEAQTVPTKLLTLFNLAIQFLSEQCHATIVLCSATQPCLEKTAHPLREDLQEIVPYDKEIWETFRRTELVTESCKLKEIPDRIRTLMETTDSLLVVCNQRRQAAYLLRETCSPAYQSFHLSAVMCMQHRRDVLAKLQETLTQNRKVLCVATQVMEAGVDLSFGMVLRLTAGMDSIVQAAGRCNRNGESKTLRPVYAINCTDENLGMQPDIQRGKTATIALLNAFQREPERFAGDLFSNESIRYYYQSFYREMEEGTQDYTIPKEKTTLFDLMGFNGTYADEDCSGVKEFFLHQAFRTAGRYFSVFEKHTVDILVPYGKGKALVAELCSARCKYDEAYRAAVLKELNQYAVGIYSYQKEKLNEKGGLISLCDGCVLMLADGFYDETVGVTVEADTQEVWMV